jgi:hypothetical protein
MGIRTASQSRPLQHFPLARSGGLGNEASPRSGARSVSPAVPPIRFALPVGTRLTHLAGGAFPTPAAGLALQTFK